MRTTRLSSNFDRKATRSGILVHSSSTELRNGHLNAGKRATLTIRWSLTYPLTLLQVIFLYVTMPLYMLVVTCWRPYSRLCSGMVRRSVIDLILFSYRYAQALKWKLFPHTRLSWIHVNCFLRGRRTQSWRRSILVWDNALTFNYCSNDRLCNDTRCTGSRGNIKMRNSTELRAVFRQADRPPGSVGQPFLDVKNTLNFHFKT